VAEGLSVEQAIQVAEREDIRSRGVVSKRTIRPFEKDAADTNDKFEAQTLEAIDLQPTESMASNAERGLKLRKEFNRGGTGVGVARARDIANRTQLSPDTIGRMVSFFARHEVDKQGEGFTTGEDGYPSAGLIAWLLWGGDSGKRWADSKWESIKRARGDENEKTGDKETFNPPVNQRKSRRKTTNSVEAT
jgi:hypothetical protein